MWSTALKEYAKQTGKFIVPKKGTPEYEAVTKIKDKLSQPAPEPEVKAPKKRKEAPPPDPELEKKLEEERKLKLELEAKEASKVARDAKKAVKEATRARLTKEREDLIKYQQSQAASQAQAQVTAASMKKLRTQKIPSNEEIAAHEELSIKKIKDRADKKIEKKLGARQRGEPSFRIEDKQIIISFKD